jgi:hypothetical protein
MVKTNNMGYKQIPANTGTFLPVSVSVFGVPNTGIPVSVYTGLETLTMTPIYIKYEILQFYDNAATFHAFVVESWCRRRCKI